MTPSPNAAMWSRASPFGIEPHWSITIRCPALPGAHDLLDLVRHLVRGAGDDDLVVDVVRERPFVEVAPLAGDVRLLAHAEQAAVVLVAGRAEERRCDVLEVPEHVADVLGEVTLHLCHRVTDHRKDGDAGAEGVVVLAVRVDAVPEAAHQRSVPLMPNDPLKAESVMYA